MCVAASAEAQATDFAELSLEELTHYDITTLGRKNATVFDTPAPADVVSGDEIHSSGALTFPEALDLAAGVQVSRIDSENYAITVRGFDDALSSKLLVLVDGRSVYNQLYSGTDWNLLDMVLDDVNRIEVQRGPAGSLWGDNAVNGVINIVSKNAHSTLGSLVSVATGDQLNAEVEVRQGFEITPAAAMRVYAKYQKQDDYGNADGADATGVVGWNARLVGSRFDWDRPGGGGLTVIGEYREVRTNDNTELPSLTPPDYDFVVPEQRREREGDLTAHWTQPVTEDGELSVLTSIDRVNSEEFVSDERYTTANIDTQVTLHPVRENEVIAGATYRSTGDDIHNTPYLYYDDPSETTNFYGAFVQDEITAVPKVFTITAGTKLERNTFTGWEVQPSVRALWHPTPSQSLWVAVSRAARTPSRSERGVQYYAATLPPGGAYPLPVELIADGASNFSSEHVLSYELGHRFELGSAFSVDTSLFFSRYTDLRGLDISLLPLDYTMSPLHLVGDFEATNSLHGYTSGGEITVRWHPAKTLEFHGSISSLRTHLHQDQPELIPDPSVAGLQGNSPDEEYKLHAIWHPAEGWTFDAVGRHTTSLSEAAVPAYTQLNLRLAWYVHPSVELAVAGRDLLKAEHTEISNSFLGTLARPIARSFFAELTFHR